MAQQTEHKHIVLNEDNRPLIEGTRMKVRELVKDYMAYGWSPEEMQWQHPHLTMAQIHAALSYYYDHQSEIDADIQRGLGLYEQLRAENVNSPARRKLRDLNLL